MDIRARHENDESERTLHDSLTGAYSPAALQPRLLEELERARRSNEELSIVLFEADNLQQVNETYGPRRSDQVIAECIQRIQALVRISDILFRYRGDEFVLVLPNTPKSQAVILGQRILRSIRSQAFPGAPPLSVSLSMGVVCFPTDGVDSMILFEKAAQRISEARHRGGGHVIGDDPVEGLARVMDELPNLVEREAELQAVHHFLDALAGTDRGLLTFTGPQGVGRSRLLAELARAGEQRGYLAVTVRAMRSTKGRPYGALVASGWPIDTPLDAGPEVIAQALQSFVDSAGHTGLLMLVDNLSELDRATVELGRQIFLSTTLSRLALAYTIDEVNVPTTLHLSPTLHEVVAVQPLSRDGLKQLLQTLLQIEPPAAFVDWLYAETSGLPAAIRQTLVRLMAEGSLTRSPNKRWTISDGYMASSPADRLRVRSRPAPYNLPTSLTSFEGREREIEQIKMLVRERSLMTLVGPSGIGKSRLALQVATGLRNEFMDGVRFVDLSPITDPELVIPTIAHTLGIQESSGVSLVESVHAALRDKHLLLILDNFEQVRASGILVAGLLVAAPALHVLITSREPLNLFDEQEYLVPSLAVPDLKRLPPLERLVQFESVRLFVERAEAARPDFTITHENAPTVAEICVRLEGLPLAIELVAPRVRQLTPQVILAHLDSRFRLLPRGAVRDSMVRLQTVRGALHWSYDLLPAEEQTLCARLAVFAGGWTFAAVEAICTEQNDQGQCQDLLQSLAEQRLIQEIDSAEADLAHQHRFVLHETIREYALDRLLASGEAEMMQQRHAEYFAALAEEAEPRIVGPDQVAWLDRLEADHHNIRAALAWSTTAEAPEQIEIGLRLASSLVEFWSVRGYYSEGYSRLATGLDRSQGPSALRARTLLAAGSLAFRKGDYGAAHACFDESLSVYRELEDRQGIAASLSGLGWVASGMDEFSDAHAQLEQSIALYRELDDQHGLAAALYRLGNVASVQGIFELARACHEESLSIQQELDNPRGIALSRNNLAIVALFQSDFDTARVLLEENLGLFRDWRDQFGMIFSLHNLAGTAYYQGEYATARVYAQESLAVEQELGVTSGDRRALADSIELLGLICLAQGDHDQATVYLVESLELRRDAGDRLGIVESLEGLAGVTVARDPHPAGVERAVRLCAVAANARADLGAPLAPPDRPRIEAILATAHTYLDATTFADAWAKGEAFTLEEAVQFALGRSG